MLHTNITSFFLGSMNHVQAEMPPRQTALDAVASSICELPTGVDGVSNT